MIRNRRESRSVAQIATGLVLALVMTFSAGVAAAGDGNGNDGAQEFGINAASAGLSLLYAPVKLVYSTLGLVFGGISYGLSAGNSTVLRDVITPAIYGDYLVFPEHLRGEKAIEFIGRAPAYREDKVVADTTIIEEVY